MTEPENRRRQLLTVGVAAVLTVSLITAVSAYLVGADGAPLRAVVTTGTSHSAGLAAVTNGIPEPTPPSPSPTPTPTPPPTPPPPRRGLAQAAADAAASAAKPSTQLAVAVFDRATGELAVGARGDEPYYTASEAKMVVAVDMLDRRRSGGLAVSDSDLDLLRRALSASDDSAMNALWSRFDGQGAAGRVSATLGLTGTSAPDNPSQWGQMEVPATDTVRIWRYVLETMPAADRQIMVDDLAAAPARARDGFDQAFGLLSPPVDGPDGSNALAKQGWMCCFSGLYYLHTAGAVGSDRRFLVALLTRQSRGPGWEAARQELDRITEAAVAPLAGEAPVTSGSMPGS